MRGTEGKCHRCGGVMVYERFYGNEDPFWGWRCTICGEIVDEVILENRRWVRTSMASIEGNSKADTTQ